MSSFGHNRERMERNFWAKVDKTGSCWIWTASLTKGGYGQVSQNGAQKMAHRVAHEWCVGPIPDGYVIDHLCEVQACVNPAHLEAVSPSVNIERALGQRTVCKYGHPLDGWCRNGATRAGRRYCKTCDQAKSRRKAARRKAKADV